MLLTRDYLTNGWTMDVGKDVPRKQADRPDVLSYARQELDFLLMLQEPNGGVHHKVAAADWLQENVAPEEDTQVKTVMPVTTTATADFAAVMAKGWLHFRDSKVSEDRSMAFKYLTAAKKAWAFLTEHPSLMMIPEMYNGQSYGGLYGDSIDRDERLWAAVELFRATNDDKFHSYIKQNILKSVLTDRLGDKTPDWSNVNFMAIFSYLQSATADSEIKQQVITHVTTYANKLLDQQRENPYQIAFAGAGNTFAWGSNSVIATTALQLAYVYKLTGNAEYKKGAAKMMNYLLGMNPNGISYVTGFGSNSVQHPHFRPHASGKYPLPKGLLIGGPNNTEFKGDLLAEAKTGDAPMKFFSDQQGSYATNEVAINWQATLAAVTALLSE